MADVTLNQDDPFEAVIARIVELNRRKRRDYALDSDPWSNFRQTAAMVSGFGHNFGPIDAVLFNIAQKIVRLQALAVNDRAPANEAVSDTWQDMAVYTIIGMILAEEADTTPVQSARLLAEVGDVFYSGDEAPGPEVLELEMGMDTGCKWHREDDDAWRWNAEGATGENPVPWSGVSEGCFPLRVTRVLDV